jgi:hypothetical protein
MAMGQAKRPAMTTTLYDLISALHMYVGVEDDRIITAIVTYLLRTGQIRFTEKSSTEYDRIRHQEDWYLKDVFAFPTRLKSQPTSSINVWEQTPVGSGCAEPGEATYIHATKEDCLMFHHR